MARRGKRSDAYEERPLQTGARLSPPSPPPGYDPHLGKQAVRFIAERWVGELLTSDRTGEVVLKTIFQDADPDIAFRIAEGIQGVEGSFTWAEPSVYVARIVHEFTRAFPDRTYDVHLGGETIVIDRLVPGPRDRRFTLESPILGHWELTVWKPGSDEVFGFTFDSFVEALTTMTAIEFQGPGLS